MADEQGLCGHQLAKEVKLFEKGESAVLRETIILATIAVVIALASAAGVRGQGLSQQGLNSLGTGIEGAPSTAAGALGGVLNGLGLGGSGAAPKGDSSDAAPGGAGSAATNDNGAQRPVTRTAAQGPCALLTADDVVSVLGESVTWSSAGAGGPDGSEHSIQPGFATDFRRWAGGGGGFYLDR